jgi:hypothetical protein
MNLKQAFGRFVIALVLASVGAPLVQPPNASAEETATMRWRVKSDYRYRAQIAFYSQSRSI